MKRSVEGEMIKGHTEMLVLAMLAGGESMHGYRIRQEMIDLSDHNAFLGLLPEHFAVGVAAVDHKCNTGGFSPGRVLSSCTEANCLMASVLRLRCLRVSR